MGAGEENIRLSANVRNPRSGALTIHDFLVHITIDSLIISRFGFQFSDINAKRV